MNKTPILMGHPYRNSAETDVRKTWARERKRLKSIADQERANEQEAAVKVSQLKTRAK